MTATLLEAWNALVQSAPAAPILTDAASGRSLTRGELDAEARAWCDAHGAGLKEVTVVLAEPNGPAWFRAFLGLLHAGAVIVPLDPGEPEAAQRETTERLRAGGRWSGGEWHRGAASPRRARDGRRLLKLTSGSTGAPRALAFTDAQMLADGRQICAGMDIRSTDTNFGLIPFGHSYGLGNLVVPLVAQGTAIVCGAAPLPHAMAATIARWRPQVFPAVPALLRALVVSDIPAEQLASLRTVISAGAPLAADVAEAFAVKFGRPVHSFYGSSETGGITYDATGEAARAGRSVGRPLPGVRLAWGRGQRFTVTSAAVMTLGGRAKSDEGWGTHRPADLAELNAEGELVLQGRAGRFVKIAGRRLNLAEVERALRGVPGVRDAWVVPHGTRADALAAAVATGLTAEALRAALHERLASWKIPKRLVTLPAFPLTARGKTDTRALRAQLESGAGS